MTKNKRIRRLIRGLGMGLGGLVGLVFVAVLLLLFAPVRQTILSMVLSRVGNALPGDLDVKRAAWPAPGALEFEDISWTDDSDSLFAAARMTVSVDLLGLLKKDIRLNEVGLQKVFLDLPAITSRFPGDSVPPADESTKDDGKGFPRKGSFPGVPSVGIERLSVNADSIRLSESVSLYGVVVAGAVDFIRGNTPRIAVDSLSVRGPGDQWGIDSLILHVDVDRGVVEGRGHGDISSHWPVFFTLVSDESDHFALVVSTTDFVASPGAPGIEVDGTLDRDGFGIRSINFKSRIHTPSTNELSADPFLARYVEGLPALSGLELAIAGVLTFEPQTSANLTCEILKNEWINRSTISLVYTPGLLSLESVSLALQGLALDATGRLTPDSIAVSSDIRVRGISWLETFRPGVGVPEDLFADIHANIVKLIKKETITAAVDAVATLSGFEIDALHVDTEFALDAKQQSRVVMTVHAMDKYLGIGAIVDRSSGIDARLSPIVIQNTSIPRLRLAVAESEPGRLKYVTDTGGLFAENVRITGDEGDVYLNARRGRAGDGAFDIRCRWSEPPAILVGALGIADSTVDSLRSAWRRDAPFKLGADGEFVTGDSLRVVSSGTFKLPGPRALRVLLPDSLRVDDLGPLEGRFELMADPAEGGMGFDVVLDLDSTTWIDSSVVRIGGVGSRVVADSVGLAVAGISVGLRGTLDDGAYDLRGIVDVADAEFARRFVKELPDIQLHGVAIFEGTPGNPNLNVSIDGSVRGDAYEIPEIASVVTVADDGLSATVQLPRGVATPHVRLDRVTATAQSTGGAGRMMPIGLTLSAEGRDASLFQTIRVDKAGGVTVDVDTLSVTVRGRDLRTARPFRVQVLSAPQTITIDDLYLEGTIGAVRVAGFVNADSSDLAGSIKIALPEKPPSVLVRQHLWPERLDADFHATGKNNINARVHIEGFALADDTRPAFDIELNGRSGEVEASISVADSAGAVLEGAGRLPASIVAYPPSATIHNGPVVFDAKLDRLPLVVTMIGGSDKIPKDQIVRVDGDIKLRGTTGAPQGFVNAKVDFSGWPKMSVYDLAIGAVLTNGGALDSTLAVSIGGFAALPAATLDEGLTATVRLLRGGQKVLSADARYPLKLSLNPPVAGTIEDKDLHIQIDSDSIPLSDFDPLLPLDIGLGGVVKMSLTATGPPDNPSITGIVTAKDLRAAVAQQASMLAQANLRLDGTRSHPVVRGEIQIDNALIRVPDLPKHLHPTEGDAVLIRKDLPDTTAPAPVDTIPSVREQPTADGEDADDADIEVTIRIPRGFWIRGKGLDLELAGDLTVVQKAGRPVVTGELRAVRGTLVTLGRSLQLERGTVTFFGGDEVNPSLDIVLTTRVEDTNIQILFGGTAQKPQMNLTSDPEMPEADIMAVLLFGRSYENLDDDQANLVRKRSTEMLASVGAVKLQEQLGGQMGIDVVTVKSTGRDNESTALSFGKYLSPRVLLSYAYALDNTTESFISLEYFVRGRFKLESTYGNQKGQTSIGIGWSKDY